MTAFHFNCGVCMSYIPTLIDPKCRQNGPLGQNCVHYLLLLTLVQLFCEGCPFCCPAVSILLLLSCFLINPTSYKEYTSSLYKLDTMAILKTNKDIWLSIIQFKLLIENKLIICALGSLHYEISREKFEPEPGFEPRTSGLDPIIQYNLKILLVFIVVHIWHKKFSVNFKISF